MNHSRCIMACTLLLAACMAYAQTKAKGVILWDDNKPAAGASITVRGTTNTTLTDSEGEYEIQANPGDVLDIVVPYYKLYYTYSAHRFNVWADAGLPIIENRSFYRDYNYETQTEQYAPGYSYLFGNDKLTGAYALPAGGIGFGYQYIQGYFLFTIGMEIQSMNYYLCYQIDSKPTSTSYYNKLDNYIVRNRTENHIYAQMPVMMGFELPHFYWEWGMKLGTGLYNGSMINATKYDWQCLRWGPSTEIGITFGKEPHLAEAQKAQKGKAEYPGRAIEYKIGLVFDTGFNHTIETYTYSNGRQDTNYPLTSFDMFLGVKFTACLQSEIHRKERRWR